MPRIYDLYRLALLLLAALLTACGGGGGEDSANGTGPGAAPTSVSSGIAVDPYIVGAQFEEVAADGKTLLQRSSTLTDALGRFTFPEPVSENSIIRLKASQKGMHGNAPFTGMLKRQVTFDDDGAVVVSPLTTLAANGMSVEEILTMLARADLPGLSEADVFADPMADLAHRTGSISDDMLDNLRANMAANCYMEVLGNFNYGGVSTAAVTLDMADIASIVRQTLNADFFNALAAEIGNDFNVGDLVNTAAQLNRVIVGQIRQEIAEGNGNLESARIDQIIAGTMQDATTVARDTYQARVDGAANDPGLDPGPGPVPDPDLPLTGAELYAAECQGCHGSLQTTNISNRTATGLQAAIDGNAGGMGGIVLTGEEIQLIADSLPIPEPPPVEPPQYRNGQAVYDQDCAGCHNLAGHDTEGNIDLAAMGSTIVAKLEGGHMGIVLPSQELNALADFADTFSPPEPPVIPRDSQTVYEESCASCHMLYGYDDTGSIDLAGMGSAAATKVPEGHGGTVSTDELIALAAWLDSWSPAPPPVIDRDGQAVYDDNCAGCHKLYGYDTSGSIDLASMGSKAETKLADGHGGSVTSGEIVNIADWLDAWAPAPPPVVDRSGETIYNQNCADCHKLYGYDASGSIDLASKGSAAATKLANGHGGPVTDGEITNVSSWLDTWAPEPPPVVARDGETVYQENCADCHKLYGYDANGNIDLASMGDTTITKLASDHGGNVLSQEILNLADWLDTWAPAPPPVVTRNGETVYNDNCAGCHKVNGYDGNGSIDLAGQGALVGGKLQTGHGGTVSADEEINLINWLNTFEASDPYAGACDSCHGQPPSGSAFPDTAGAHAVHAALNGVGGDCSACHADASHNDGVDVSFQAAWDAKSGAAQDNGDGTCSNISCHGGVKTPDWNSGFINVDTQCRSCHTAGTGQYIGYDSGKHDKHVRDKKLDCTACHDPARLRNGHFGNLETRTFEQAPSATIRSSLSYSEGRCMTVNCHDDGERW